ncbi:AMP-binding protein [Nocardioides halotolerans]|uniref:AMP-binding protein n=1 Tax=Nocardioides halotolerans TaxID=433660 RepID=UPI00041EC0D4|nr:AMP-binding protein [Nocardioides halotolerans]
MAVDELGTRLVDPLLHWLEEDPARTFLRTPERTWSYEELWAECRRIAGGLESLGVAPGDRVALLLDNHADFVATWFGTVHLGAVMVPVNTAFHGASLSYVLGQSGATTVVTEHQYLDRVDAVRAELPDLRTVVVRGGPADAPGHPMLTELAGEPTARHGAGGDPAAIVYTSGTTGRSKGVVIPHRYYLQMARTNGRAMRLTRDDVYYTCLPLFHGMAQLSGTMGPLLAGGQVVVVPRFSVSRFWTDCRDHAVTGFGAIAAMTSMLFKQAPDARDRDHRVRFAFAVAVPASIEAAFERRFGVRLINGFGMTEAGQMTYMPYDAPRPGTCGKPVDLYQLEIHDPADHPLPPGEVGEIVVRPTAPSVTMSGYHDMPEQTLSSWRNLWLHTGDLGRLDQDGYLYFVDRNKDAIRRRGENISSLEVEAALLQHDDILEVAAYPVPSELGEDDVMVAVVSRPGLTAAGLWTHCRAVLPSFAVPRYVRFVDALPKTPTQKVEKYRLRAEAVTGDTADASG